ncbi:MAG: chromate transporter [Deltaproteobacteria bacterium RBG_13_58_19]|nr:MAG: chromate transporter [Deltaproteobacteria bacterium RBG_13_58_19]
MNHNNLPVDNPKGNSHNLRELAFLFFRLGTTAFGGPAAHIAMMQDEVVRRRGWLTHEKFLDLLGATNLIPGPNSTEMAIHIGFLRAGWTGLVVAGVSFIIPAVVLVTAFAWAYVRFRQLPELTWLLYGVKPVVIAIVLQALWGLGRTAIKTKFLGMLAILAVALNFLGVDELALLLGTGMLVGWWQGLKPDPKGNLRALLLMTVLVGGFLAAVYFALQIPTSTKVQFSLPALFLFFCKVGSILFGSGYVLLAFLQADLVQNWHWLTATQLLDATAVGQITPGPVFTTATFIGYLLGGLPGALIGTAGIFLPAFFFVAVSGPLVPLLRKSIIAGAFLDGVIVASLALMAVVTWRLGRDAVIDPVTALLVLGSALLLIRFRLNSLWLVLGGALIGLLVHLTGLANWVWR